MASQVCMYGDLLTEPELPSREGYIFEDWYIDESGTIRWNFDVDVVNGGMELYAVWKEEQD
ncbi:MAG: InlB B-repeat-containing protein [Clostridiales bacterium]|nr:InlB B-repeat-containing protein [Clostridiales bacterium]